jgi:hypothetical protein
MKKEFKSLKKVLDAAAYAGTTKKEKDEIFNSELKRAYTFKPTFNRLVDRKRYKDYLNADYADTQIKSLESGLNGDGFRREHIKCSRCKQIKLFFEAVEKKDNKAALEFMYGAQFGGVADYNYIGATLEQFNAIANVIMAAKNNAKVIDLEDFLKEVIIFLNTVKEYNDWAYMLPIFAKLQITQVQLLIYILQYVKKALENEDEKMQLFGKEALLLFLILKNEYKQARELMHYSTQMEMFDALRNTPRKKRRR